MHVHNDLFDTTTREGKMLYFAIAALMQPTGPPETRGKEAAEIVAMLDEAVATLDDFKM